MRLSELSFASYLVYTRRGTSDVSIRARNFVVSQLKQDAIVAIATGQTRITATAYLADRLKSVLGKSTLQGFFSGDETLVPVPGSGLTVPDALWVPQNLATELVRRGIGRQVAPLLRRVEPVAKSAFAGPGERPSPQEHFETMAVQAAIEAPKVLCLVDDVVTKGSTLLGAANRLAEAFPEAEIRAFAAVRHVGFREEIDSIEEPCVGIIRLTSSGEADRDP